MVNNQVWDYVKSELGRSISPYNGDSPIEEDEARELFEGFSYDTGLEDFDALILHNPSSKEENELRYDIFEKAAFHLQASGNNPKMFVPEKFRDDIDASEVIHPSTVEYLDETEVEDELSQVYKRFSGTGRIHVSSDYDAAEVEKISRDFDEDDFVVFSADTSGENLDGKLPR